MSPTITHPCSYNQGPKPPCSLTIDSHSLFAATFVLSFIKYSTKVYDAYATSAFSKHAALATANVVYTIMNMVTYPVLARLSDVRLSTELTRLGTVH